MVPMLAPRSYDHPVWENVASFPGPHVGTDSVPQKKIVLSRQTCDSCPFKPVCWAAAPHKRRCEVGTVFGGPHALSYVTGMTVITLMTMLIFMLLA